MGRVEWGTMSIHVGNRGCEDAQDSAMSHRSFTSSSVTTVGKRMWGRGPLSAPLPRPLLGPVAVPLIRHQIRKWPDFASPLYPCAKPVR